jgi:hypothetical protein
MVKIFGKYYYIDLDMVINSCESGKSYDEHGSEHTEINVFKYDIIKMCIDRVLNEYEEMDEKMSIFSETQVSPSFKISFNTLIKSNILIEYDEE